MNKSVRLLAAHVEWVRAILVEHVSIGRSTFEPPEASEAVIERAEEIERIATETDARVPLEIAAHALGLEVNEAATLWLLASVELDAGLTLALSEVIFSREISIQMLQQLLLCAGHSILRPEQIERLAQLSLVECLRDPMMPMWKRTIRASDRTLQLAEGYLRLDPEIERIARIEEPTHVVTVPDAVTRALASRDRVVVVVTGVEGGGRSTVLRAAHGKRVMAIDTAELARDAKQLGKQLRAIARDCALFDAAPLLRNLDTIGDEPGRRHLLEHDLFAQVRGPILATASELKPWRSDRTIVVAALPRCSESERATIWQAQLPGATEDVTRDAAARYAVVPGAIVAAARSAVAIAGTPAPTVEHVHAGLRHYLDQRLGSLATRIEWKQTWDDLVLPPSEFEQLLELVARVKHRKLVQDDWGFADKVAKGLGVTAMFSGPPGTGKTMVAGLVAAELGLDLYQVDLSRVVSKYIGETEKHLATLFDAAEAGHSILLFDEADALFAKRSEVKSSNDRNANLEVNYLLQRMEAFRGITLLTTNHETAIDPAFQRRIAVHVRFPMPEREQRALLWKAMFPPQAAIATDVDLDRLAKQFVLSGAYIRNAVLRAAYLAAEQQTPITMALLERSATLEYEVIGRLPRAA